jgi:hypothetical protein
MNLKRRLLLLVYAVLLVGMCYSGLQLFGEKTAQAEAGVCCAFSSQCPGSQLCYAPSGTLEDCCDTTQQVDPPCTGASYCRDKPSAD